MPERNPDSSEDNFGSLSAAVDNQNRPLGETHVDLRLILDTIPAIVLSASADGRDDFFNKGWIEYTNLSAEELLDALGDCSRLRIRTSQVGGTH
jgi:PAS domain-containing protein